MIGDGPGDNHSRSWPSSIPLWIARLFLVTKLYKSSDDYITHHIVVEKHLGGLAVTPKQNIFDPQKL